MLKQNTSAVPYFGAVTVPDQIEGAVMPPIDENNLVIKTSCNAVATESTGALSSSIIELSYGNECTNNSNNNNSTSTPQFLKSEAQTSIEMQNVSNN